MKAGRERRKQSKVEISTESTRVLFQKYETDFYDEKVDFVDEHHQGRKCVLHGNEWSNLDPVEMNWCFSDEVKIAHTTSVFL